MNRFTFNWNKNINKGIAVYEMARAAMNYYGLTDWSFSYDHAKRRMGACHFSKKMITLSKHYVTRNDFANIEDTILHEIAHALDHKKRGTSDHGPKWKAIARQIGCKAARCGSAEMPKGRFKYQCPNCKMKIHKHRRLKHQNVCLKCCNQYSGGKIDKRFTIELISTEAA
jgi:predicted SprT family Zn-dependent metalloprotease